jgi:hypothetical protein
MIVFIFRIFMTFHFRPKYSAVSQIAELEAVKGGTHANSLYVSASETAIFSNQIVGEDTSSSSNIAANLVAVGPQQFNVGGALKGSGLFVEYIDCEQGFEFGFGGHKSKSMEISDAPKFRNYVIATDVKAIDAFVCTSGVVLVLDNVIDLWLRCIRFWQDLSAIPSNNISSEYLSNNYLAAFVPSKLVQHPCEGVPLTEARQETRVPVLSRKYSTSSFSSDFNPLSPSAINAARFKNISSLDFLDLTTTNRSGRVQKSQVTPANSHEPPSEGHHFSVLVEATDLVLTAASNRDFLAHIEIGGISAAVKAPTSLNRSDVTVFAYPDLYFDVKKFRMFDFSCQYASLPVFMWTSNCVLADSMVTVAWKNLVDIAVDCKDLKICLLQKFVTDLLVYIFDRVQGPIFNSIIKLYTEKAKEDMLAATDFVHGHLSSILKSDHAVTDSLLQQFSDSSDDEDILPSDESKVCDEDIRSVSSNGSAYAEIKTSLHVREIMEPHSQQFSSRILSPNPHKTLRPKTARPDKGGADVRTTGKPVATSDTRPPSTVEVYQSFVKDRLNYRVRLTNIMLIMPRNSVSQDMVGFSVARVIIQNTLVSSSWLQPSGTAEPVDADKENFQGVHFDIKLNDWTHCGGIYDGGVHFGLRGDKASEASGSPRVRVNSPRGWGQDYSYDVPAAWLPHDMRTDLNDTDKKSKLASIHPVDIVSRVIVQVTGIDVFTTVSDARFGNHATRDPRQVELEREGGDQCFGDIVDDAYVFESSYDQIMSPHPGQYVQRWRKVSEFAFNLQYIQDYVFIVAKNPETDTDDQPLKHVHTLSNSDQTGEISHTTKSRVLIGEMEQESPLVVHLSLVELAVVESVWFDNIHEISHFFAGPVPLAKPIPGGLLPRPFPAYGSADYFKFLSSRDLSWDLLVVRTDVKLFCYMEPAEYLPVVLPALLDGKVSSQLLKTGYLPQSGDEMSSVYASRNHFGADLRHRPLESDVQLGSQSSRSDDGFIAFPVASLLLSCLVLHCAGDDDVVLLNAVAAYAEIVDTRSPKQCAETIVLSVGTPNVRKFGRVAADFGFDILPPFANVPILEALQVSMINSSYSNWTTCNVGLGTPNATLGSLDLFFVLGDFFGAYFWEETVSSCIV